MLKKNRSRTEVQAELDAQQDVLAAMQKTLISSTATMTADRLAYAIGQHDSAAKPIVARIQACRQELKQL